MPRGPTRTGVEAPAAPRSARRLILACFVLSGFAAVLYQTVWMRVALAMFGVNTAIVAAVLSVFMLGLMLGSAAAGRVVAAARARAGLSPLRVYAAAEIVIGTGGVLVPVLLGGGRRLLLGAGPAGAAYTLASLAAILLALLPFCVAMGITYPAAIAFLDEARAAGPARDPFGALYLANVAGAVVGALATPVVLIESFGFRRTSIGACAVNAAIAALALLHEPRRSTPREAPEARRAPAAPGSRRRRAALFVTGFTTMGMELVWTRMYPTLIGTFVYSFAAILVIYLLATTAGAALYRRRVRPGGGAGAASVWPWVGPAAILPLLSASTSLPPLHPIVLIVLGLAPFCAMLGYVTPALVDEEGADDPDRVGVAYAVNLAGCLAGPLVAGLVLLPVLGTRWTVAMLALPLFVPLLPGGAPRRRSHVAQVVGVGIAAVVWFSTTLFEERVPASQVRHDRVATVVAEGSGIDKSLFVNGVGMTKLVTKTKMMAHFPAAHLAIPAGDRFDALVICFGMGTTFRSLASWGADVTAVELVPSVPELFGYFFPDGPRLLAERPDRLRLVLDDGRRYLDRARRRFDLITLDPPPPVEAAGSSLLYSRELCAAARRSMKPGAILQLWLPGGDRRTIGGVAAAVISSFPYVRVFPSVDGDGLHFLASDRPIARMSAEDLARRLPELARRDLAEWTSAPPATLFAAMLAHEYDPASLLADGRLEATPVLTDDRPLNEFYMLRRLKGAWLSPATAAGREPRGAAGLP